ncbi:MAG: hypothetical protein AVDCRST_MAG66-2650 [uncultured Pseudonocardia sp.]|uniref:Uncharacterized protein n=1 Tax=uncultured Pseudonocardia sp. TaxID=211455 RepID=A0A6J4PPK5_9PSEU|nr:MAG: hypothetical protein AVDCRST_MAG66-2650 [uncultured Pseudonocardia sp.]
MEIERRHPGCPRTGDVRRHAAPRVASGLNVRSRLSQLLGLASTVRHGSFIEAARQQFRPTTAA